VIAPEVETAVSGSSRSAPRLLDTVRVAAIMPVRFAGSARTVTSRTWFGASVCGSGAFVGVPLVHVVRRRGFPMTLNSFVIVPAPNSIEIGFTIVMLAMPVLVMQNVRSSVASKRRLPKASVAGSSVKSAVRPVPVRSTSALVVVEVEPQVPENVIVAGPPVAVAVGANFTVSVTCAPAASVVGTEPAGSML
jgi:hypothetical protein